VKNSFWFYNYSSERPKQLFPTCVSRHSSYMIYITRIRYSSYVWRYLETGGNLWIRRTLQLHWQILAPVNLWFEHTQCISILLHLNSTSQSLNFLPTFSLQPLPKIVQKVSYWTPFLIPALFGTAIKYRKSFHSWSLYGCSVQDSCRHLHLIFRDMYTNATTFGARRLQGRFCLSSVRYTRPGNSWYDHYDMPM
jgi:hypothetical protein